MKLLSSIQTALSLLIALSTTQHIRVANALSSSDYRGNETDHTALLAIKSQLHQPDAVLSSWNNSHHHCFWEGVTCGLKHKRVTDLYLSGRGLAGTISPFIGNLSFLRNIWLTNNSLYGLIPLEIGRLFRLRSLYLTNNSLTGEIPANISGCISLRNFSVAINNLEGELPMGLRTLPNLNSLLVYSNKLSGPVCDFIQNLTSLEVIYVDFNAFTGTIPNSISKMKNLNILSLSSNKLSGMIPSSISNLSSLQYLYLDNNQLRGHIPRELGALSNLKYLRVSENKLSGMIPSSISNISSLQKLHLENNQLQGNFPTELEALSNLNYLSASSNELSGVISPSIFNLSSLRSLDLHDNQLRGSIPPDIGFTLPQLKYLGLFNNYFSGPLPISLSNLTSLQTIELSYNNFTGSISNLYFGHLLNLQWLNLYSNNLVGDINFIITTLVNCTYLQALNLQSNNFTGLIPTVTANLSIDLSILSIGVNQISGRIPQGISNLINLNNIGMSESGLTGTIPEELGKLQKLEKLYLYSNRLTGQIPDFFGNLSRLSSLYLFKNELQGRLPQSLGICTNLLYSDLSSNQLNGSFPNELFAKTTSFIELDVSQNRLEGSLLMDISEQLNLKWFYLNKNNFTGVIPDVFSSLPALEELDMGDNFFQGPIPPSFASLKSLVKIDISRNNLSGPVPEYFSSFPLMYLNLSYNNFEGKVPTKGVFANTTAISLVGNNKLCGGILELHLPRCVEKERKKRKMSRALRLTVLIICAFVVLLAMAICIWLYLKGYYSKKRNSNSSELVLSEPFFKVSYNMLHKATNGFSLENLLGSGAFGAVFTGMLDGKTVAIKVLNLKQRGGSKSFMAECKALRNIHHRNLVGILTACASMDFQRNDFKALVYEFMPNGSLDRWLNEDYGNLSLLQRMNIAIDVAHALNYLHHECGHSIVHCDLKPSNILLDHNMVARVSDFGLAKILDQPINPNQSSSIGVRGTVGYAAPEYGLGGEASIEADLYSYGILLLELMTGKRPTGHMFKEDFNLHMYAKAALPDQVLQIVDPTLMVTESDESESRIQAMLQKREECMVLVIKIGVACSNHLPRDRMEISVAISELQQARKILLIQSVKTDQALI